MAAAHRFVSPPPRPSHQTVKPAPEHRVIHLPVRTQASPEKLPWWVRALLLMQHTSAVVAVGLVGSTLLTYAMTVYSQQLWNRQYRQLETLQRHKRDLVATHETLKHQLAREAEQGNNGLVNPQPTHTIFLPATGKQSFREPTAIPSAQKPSSHAPIGY